MTFAGALLLLAALAMLRIKEPQVDLEQTAIPMAAH
jgi:hypothetical protein